MADIKTIKTNCPFCGIDHRPSAGCETLDTVCVCDHVMGDHLIGCDVKRCPCNYFTRKSDDTAYRYDSTKITDFSYDVIINCAICNFEPQYGAWDIRDQCGCTGLVTYLLERAQVLGGLLG